MHGLRFLVLACVLVAGLLGGEADAVNIETVPVGNPGNAGDARYPDTYNGVSSFGAVSYSYNMGTYEVTAGQYTAFLNQVASVDAYGLYSTAMSRTDYGSGISRSGSGTPGAPYTYSVASEFVNRPVNCVSWGDAARFANWLHNRQPTGVEDPSTTEDGSYSLNGATNYVDLMAVTREDNATWVIPGEDECYIAAYHMNDVTTGNYYDYTTSIDSAPGRDMIDADGNNANYSNGGKYNPIDSGKFATVSGEFQNSLSPYGTFDQGGNVGEWNEAVLFGTRGMRGGSWRSYDNALHASSRGGHRADPGEYHIGFRVACVPEPATLAMLSLGCFAVLRRRGR